MVKLFTPTATPVRSPVSSGTRTNKSSSKPMANISPNELGSPSRLLGIVVVLMIILISTIVILYYSVLTCNAPGAIIMEPRMRRDTLSEYLNSILDLDSNPCNDFYGYVCGGYLRRARNLNRTSATTIGDMHAESVKWLSTALLRPIKDDDDIALKLSKTFYRSCYTEGTTGDYGHRAADFNALLMGVEKTAGIPFPYRTSEDPVANALPADNVNALLAADTFSRAYARILIEFAPAYKRNVLNLFDFDLELVDDETTQLVLSPPAFLYSICGNSRHSTAYRVRLVRNWIVGTLNDSRAIFKRSPELYGGRLDMDMFAGDLLNFVDVLAAYFCGKDEMLASRMHSDTRTIAQLSYRYLNATALFGEFRRLNVTRHMKEANVHATRLGDDPHLKLVVYPDYFEGIEELFKKGNVSTRQLIAVLYYNVFSWHASGWRRFTSRAAEMNTMRPYVLEIAADEGGAKRRGVEHERQRFSVDWERDERRRKRGWRGGIESGRLRKRDVNSAGDDGKRALTASSVDVVMDKCVDLLKKELRGAVDYVFVTATPPAERKSVRSQLSIIVDYVRQGFHSLLYGTRWLDVESRAMAVRKLNAMHIRLPNADTLAAAADELWLGIQSVIRGGGAVNATEKLLLMDYRRLAICATLARLRKQLGLVMRKVTVQDYFETVVLEQQSTIDVNAMYFISLNTLVINAGIAQSPLFDLYWPMEWNFGALGSVIGHEISHAFDLHGMNFNEVGEWEPWFNNSLSIAEFIHVSECIADEYSAFCRDDDVVSGVCIDGRRTMAENLADNAGLHAAFRGFTHYMTTSSHFHYRFDAPKYQRLTDGQLFFIAFTQVWCSYMHNDDQIRFDDADVHAPDVYRPLGTLRNNPSFGNTYNCTSGNVYYPENYCHVWYTPVR